MYLKFLPKNYVGYISDIKIEKMFESTIDIKEKNSTIIYYSTHKLIENSDEWWIGNTPYLNPNAFNTSIKSHTFENGVGTIKFNDVVTKISKHAIYDIEVTKIILPDSITYIGDWAFNNCFNITEFNIPRNTKFLGMYSLDFTYLCKMPYIIIPDSVETIKHLALGNAEYFIVYFGKNLKTLESLDISVENAVFTCLTPPKLESSRDLIATKVYVPDLSIDLYRNDSLFSNYTLYPLSEFVEPTNYRYSYNPELDRCYNATMYKYESLLVSYDNGQTWQNTDKTISYGSEPSNECPPDEPFEP